METIILIVDDKSLFMPWLEARYQVIRNLPGQGITQSERQA